MRPSSSSTSTQAVHPDGVGADHVSRPSNSFVSRATAPYFDQQPRGEVLSRATNDTDNISQTLQQTMSQLIFSVLTVVGVLAEVD